MLKFAANTSITMMIETVHIAGVVKGTYTFFNRESTTANVITFKVISGC